MISYTLANAISEIEQDLKDDDELRQAGKFKNPEEGYHDIRAEIKFVLSKMNQLRAYLDALPNMAPGSADVQRDNLRQQLYQPNAR